MIIVGSILILSSILLLYLKYRVVFNGEKCKGKIVGIVDRSVGYSIRGANVIKHAYIVNIDGKKYYTAHGCLILALGKKHIGKEITIYKSEKYGNEVFKCLEFRIEITSLLLLLLGLFIIMM